MQVQFREHIAVLNKSAKFVLLFTINLLSTVDCVNFVLINEFSI